MSDISEQPAKPFPLSSKESDVSEWIVPMQLVIDCDVIVEADSSSEASEIADTGAWKSRSYNETVDWKVTGPPEKNE